MKGHRCAALANIAFLSMWTGDREQAEGAFGEIADAVPKGGTLWFSVLDSRSVWSCLGELESCDDYLRAGETEVRVRELPPFACQSL